MSVLFNGAVSGSSSVDTGDIGHSLRCRSAASAYLSRTPVTPVITDLWSMSFWIKRGQLGTKMLGGCGTVAGNSFAYCFDTTDHLQAYYPGTGAILNAVTNGVFRDHTAFIHVVMSCDLGNAVPADRFQFWVNGVRQTLSTYNFTAGLNFNNNQPQQICKHPVWSLPNDGYMSRICFVDQQQLTPSSFGYLNTEINEWVSKSQSAVKAVVDAGGTNSFMLDFDDATSLTTLGYDKSSKGNNWTLNNFSLTAGTTYDHMLDVPGNSYATLTRMPAAGIPLSSANLNWAEASGSATWKSNWGGVAIPTTGKWYFEAGISTSTGATNSTVFGLHDGLASTLYCGNSANTYGFAHGGQLYNNSGTVRTLTGYTTGNVVQIAFDADAGKLWFGVNGTWREGDPAAGTSPSFSGLSASAQRFFGVSTYWATPDGNSTGFANFGQRPFAYTPPTGFKALCQRNLPDPAILNPELHFDVKLDTGVNIKTTMDALFSGNVFEWIKDRANSNNHQLADVNRGLTAILQSNTTAAETTYSAPSGSSVGWGWKMGGAAVTNNSGSISSQVSANVLAGQSVVTATCQGSGTATVGHGLGKAPALILYKRRGAASSWGVYHHALGPGQYVLLESSAALVSDTTVWNNTLPTSSVFTLGTPYAGLGDYVFLCFAEIPGFSKLRYYTGNGSADGPVVECGFKPKYVLIKGAGNASNWNTFDGERSPSNLVDDLLRLNLADAENVSGGTSIHVDFTATGFKIRGGSVDLNANGVAYIFYAIADVAGKYALGR